ncbi:MAG: hypothetical protein HYY22_08355 [Thaumarchaeota archaeon]|nr:hypothetical protein [Nitrososphaerota archaeon]
MKKQSLSIMLLLILTFQMLALSQTSTANPQQSDKSVPTGDDQIKIYKQVENQSSSTPTPRSTPIVGHKGAISRQPQTSASHAFPNHWWMIDYWTDPYGTKMPSEMSGSFVAVDNTIQGLQFGLDFSSNWFDAVMYIPLNVAYGTSNTNCVWFQFDVQFANPAITIGPDAVEWFIWDVRCPGTTDQDYDATSIGLAYVPGHEYQYSLTTSGTNTVTFTITDLTTGETWSNSVWQWTVPSLDILYDRNIFSPASAVETYATSSFLTGIPYFQTRVGDQIPAHWYRLVYLGQVPTYVETYSNNINNDIWYWEMESQGQQPLPTISSVDYPRSTGFGEPATIDVTATNDGGTAQWQTISVSFPADQPVSDVKIVGGDLCSSCYKVYPAGETIKSTYSTSDVTLKTYLVEGFSTDWVKDETHHLKLSVTPTETGLFTFYVKSVAAVTDWVSNWTPKTGLRDQENEYVFPYTINVTSTTPAAYTLSFQGYDYDNTGEASILVNNQPVANLPVSESSQNNNIFTSFSLDISKYVVSGSNTITFKQNLYSSGVKNLVVKNSDTTTIIYSNATQYNIWAGGGSSASVTYKFNSPNGSTTTTTTSTTTTTTTTTSSTGPLPSDQYTLSFQGYDYDNKGESSILVNNQVVASLPASESSANNNVFKSFSLDISKYVVAGSSSNTIVFKQNLYSSGVQDVRVTGPSGELLRDSSYNSLWAGGTNSATYKFSTSSTSTTTTTMTTTTTTTTTTSTTSTSTSYSITFQGYDYDNKGEVTVLVNNQVVVSLPTVESYQNNNVWMSFSLDISKYVVSGANIITFKQNLYSSGVKDVKVTSSSSTLLNDGTEYSIWAGGTSSVTYKFNVS